MIRSNRTQRIVFIIAAALMAANISACNVNINVNGSPIEHEDGANSDESREPVIAEASDSLIYTEGVVICKTDEDLPKRMPKEDWVTVDVITMAAPDLRDKSNMHAALIGNGTYMNNAELFGYHVKRAMHMLTVAAHKEVDILVLGAFGCGAFQNDPEVVARAYRTALDEFPKLFKKIEFAVYCPAVDTTNYSVFKRVLG